MDFSGVRVSPESLLVRGLAQGAVAADKTVTVQIGGTNVLCLADRDITLAAGDVVLGVRNLGTIIIFARLYAAAPVVIPEEEKPPPPPPPEPEIRTGRLTISPVETRSWRPTWGWRKDNDDVYQGEYGSNGNHKGCAFYGTKPRSLDGSTITKATIKVKRGSAGMYAAETTTLRMITNRTKPGGEPNLTGSSTTGPRLAVGSSTTFTIPDSFGQALVDGSAGGLAIYASDGDPYVKLLGRASWSPSWTLTLEWRRVT